MSFDDPFGNGEAEPAAAVILGAGIVHPIESVEHAR
jgi:hypothetical protein